MESGEPRSGLLGLLTAILLYGGLLALDAAIPRPAGRAAATPPAATPPAAAPPAAAPPAAAPPAAAPPAAPPATLVIRLDPLRPPRPLAAPRLDVASFWPTPEEAALPRGELTLLLEQVLTLELEHQTARLPAASAALLRAAEAAALSPAAGRADRPWEALLILEVARRRTLSEQPGGTGAGRGSPAGDATEPAPARGGTGGHSGAAAALRLADAVAARSEGTLAGDIAELYALYALADPTAATFDPRRAADAALNLLYFTDDFAVMEAAAELLAGLPEPPVLPAADRALLAGVLSEVEAPPIRDRLGWMLLEQSARTRDPALGRAVLADLEALGEATCRERDHSPICAGRQAALASAEGLLAARSGTAPERWRPALAAAAWRCHITGPPLGELLSVDARWDGVWELSGWSARPPLAACLERELRAAAGPPEPLTIRLELVPPSPRLDSPE